MSLTSPEDRSSTPIPIEVHLTKLPFEIRQQIISYVSPLDLVALRRTCQVLLRQIDSSDGDKLWKSHICSNLPGVELNSEFWEKRISIKFSMLVDPNQKYRELYKSHFPNWFLPKHTIWFSNQERHGKLIIVRYDPVTDSILGYRLVAERSLPTSEHWAEHPDVILHSFKPRCRLRKYFPSLSVIVFTQRRWRDISIECLVY